MQNPRDMQCANAIQHTTSMQSRKTHKLQSSTQQKNTQGWTRKRSTEQASEHTTHDGRIGTAFPNTLLEPARQHTHNRQHSHKLQSSTHKLQSKAANGKGRAGHTHTELREHICGAAVLDKAGIPWEYNADVGCVLAEPQNRRGPGEGEWKYIQHGTRLETVVNWHPISMNEVKRRQQQALPLDRIMRNTAVHEVAGESEEYEKEEDQDETVYATTEREGSILIPRKGRDP